MKWLEIIELRSTGVDRTKIERRLRDLAGETERETKPRAIELYIHGLVETDLSVHVIHDSEPVDVTGSPLGLHLASALKQFGLVNHSVWIEKSSGI